MKRLLGEMPNTTIRVTRWMPHPCGGYYIADDLLYGPSGPVARFYGWIDD